MKISSLCIFVRQSCRCNGLIYFRDSIKKYIQNGQERRNRFKIKGTHKAPSWANALFARRILQWESFICKHLGHHRNIRWGNTDEILHRRNIPSEMLRIFFFFFLFSYLHCRALSNPPKQIIFISKQNACVTIPQTFSGREYTLERERRLEIRRMYIASISR